MSDAMAQVVAQVESLHGLIYHLATVTPFIPALMTWAMCRWDFLVFPVTAKSRRHSGPWSIPGSTRGGPI